MAQNKKYYYISSCDNCGQDITLTIDKGESVNVCLQRAKDEEKLCSNCGCIFARGFNCPTVVE